jgi:hypothetical protein
MEWGEIGKIVVATFGIMLAVGCGLGVTAFLLNKILR